MLPREALTTGGRIGTTARVHIKHYTKSCSSAKLRPIELLVLLTVYDHLFGFGKERRIQLVVQ